MLPVIPAGPEPPILVAPRNGPSNGVALAYGDVTTTVAHIFSGRVWHEVPLSRIGKRDVWTVALAGFESGFVELRDAYDDSRTVSAAFSLTQISDTTGPVWQGPVVVYVVRDLEVPPPSDIGSQPPQPDTEVIVTRPPVVDDSAVAVVIGGGSNGTDTQEVRVQTFAADRHCLTFSAVDFAGNIADVTGCEDDDNSQVGCASAPSTASTFTLALVIRRRRSRRR
jgi:hypothetical protein